MTPRGGFTLVELLLVVLIVGVVAMMVGPATQSMLLEARLNAAAGELVGALEYARSCAIRYQRTFAVGWLPERGVIGVCDRQYMDDNTAHPDEDPAVGTFGVVHNPFDKKPYTIVVNDGTDTQGIRLTLPPEDVLFIFYPDGHVFTSSASVGVALAQMQRTITVSVSTGHVAVN